MKKELLNQYNDKKIGIKTRLSEFKKLPEKEYFKEFLFCLLTPQSNAYKCWSAVEELSKLSRFEEEKVRSILQTRTRFHNNKTNYIMQAEATWNKIKPLLSEKEGIELRNLITENVKGYGLKEAGHFLRNIGKSNNKVAILDRHILRNLVALEVIKEEKIKNAKHYLEIEQKFLEFSKEMNIPIDELDLLFWSKENGKIFK